MMKSYNTVLETAQIENVIKKSRFIAFVFPCESVESFMEQLDEIKGQYPNARHYCYAYRIIDQILTERYNDDHEPSGTAGMPMLEVLKGQDLQQCGVVVVRYFGGTLLGTGGLSRAYSEACRDALGQAKIVIRQSAIIYQLSCDYGLSGKMEYLWETEQIPVIHTSYSDRVCFTLAVLTERDQEIKHKVMELTGGQGELQKVKEVEGYFSEKTFVEA